MTTPKLSGALPHSRATAPTAYGSLPTAYYALRTAYCLLPTASCLLPPDSAHCSHQSLCGFVKHGFRNVDVKLYFLHQRDDVTVGDVFVDGLKGNHDAVN